jgi:prepilin-type N-terminal cleavage/methylation domain-containing protein/prepilin-type processing-associated H-X9-DG protein
MRQRVGYTLIEVLIVISIIALLLSLLMMAVGRVRAAAARVNCANNMRQIGLALQQYADVNNNLPPGQLGPYQQFRPGIASYGWGPTSRGWSFLARLLPFIEQDALFRQANIPQSILQDTPVIQKRIALYRCPADDMLNQTTRLDAGNFPNIPLAIGNYKGVAGSSWGYDRTQNLNFPSPYRHKGIQGNFDGLDDGDGAMFRTDIFKPRRYAMFTDGLSNTLLIGEDLPRFNDWLSWPYANHAYGTCAIPLNLQEPTDNTPWNPHRWYYTSGFRSNHTGGANFTFADGSVRFVRDGLTMEVYRAAATIYGGETLQID